MLACKISSLRQCALTPQLDATKIGVQLSHSCLQVMEHGMTVKKLSAVEVAKEAAEGSVRASADAARKAEAALVRPLSTKSHSASSFGITWCIYATRRACQLQLKNGS